MTTAKSEFDHALANQAMRYLDSEGRGVSQAKLDAVKEHDLYGALLAEIEATWPCDRQKISLACDVLLTANFTPRAA